MLDDAGASATFFVQAPLARRQPTLPSRMREAGHEVAFHCTRHVRHDRLTRTEISEDVRAGLGALTDLGHPPRHWRVPWGLVTGATEAVAKAQDPALAGWSVDTEDWRGDPAEEPLARPSSGPQHRSRRRTSYERRLRRGVRDLLAKGGVLRPHRPVRGASLHRGVFPDQTRNIAGYGPGDVALVLRSRLPAQAGVLRSRAGAEGRR